MVISTISVLAYNGTYFILILGFSAGLNNILFEACSQFMVLLISGGALKNLLSKIKGQRDEWVQRSASSTETDPSVRSSDQESTG